MIIDTTKDFPFGVHSNYNNFRLTQYHFKVEGLWVLNSKYFIHCPGLTEESKAINGQPMVEWYEHNKILLCRTELVNSIPEGADRVKDLSIEDVSNLAGVLRNLTHLYHDVLKLLPKEFPLFKAKNGKGANIDLFFEKTLTNQEFSDLERAVRLQQLPLTIEIKIVDDLNGFKDQIIEVPSVLWINRRHGKLSGSRAGIKLYEKDEDFWSQNKKIILEGTAEKNDFLPSHWELNKSSCIVTDNLRPDNIRTFLTLFDTTYLNLPVIDCEQEYFENLGVTHDELGLLVESKRVKFLLPHNLQRYSHGLLEFLDGLGTESFLLSRQLACHTITDLRNRNPLMFSTINIDLKVRILRTLRSYFGKYEKMDIVGTNLIEYLSRGLGDYFTSIHRFGAMGIHDSGSHELFNYIIRIMTGKDLRLELSETAPGVEFGASLNATVIPRNWENYSDENLALMLSNLYSGVPRNSIPKNWNYSNTVIDDILIINKEVPVLDLATTFSGGDIDRFRKMIFNLTEHKKDKNELNESVKLFNQQVTNFENSNKRTKKMGISGFLISGYGAAASLPFSGWITERLNQVLIDAGLSNKGIQLLMDELAVMRTNESLPSAVMVARMRGQLTAKWYQSKKK